MRSWTAAILAGGAALLALGSASAVWASHYEAPTYTVAGVYPGFEVRQYDPRLHAEVTVTGSQQDSISAAFRILAAYIFGRNQPRETIGMTVPVGQQPAGRGGESIGMTVPVGQQPVAGASGEWVVWFVMPARYTLETLPAPQDGRIHLRPEAAHRAAVLSFRGRVREDTFAVRAAELLAAVEAAGLQPAGPPTLAQYSAPSVPGPLRHNEVQVKLLD